MLYDFDTVIERTNAAKWKETYKRFGTNDLLPFWFADMDFKSPQPIIEALVERAMKGDFGYASRPESYFEAMLDWFRLRHGWSIDRESIIFSPGIIAAMCIIIREMTEPGDKIIIQPPVYPPFFDVVTKNNRELVLNPLKIENGRYYMDFDDLEKKMDSKVKFLILCSPHNPVGRVWEKSELEQLGEICFKHGVKIISDEVHCDIVYRPYRHVPSATVSEEFKNNCITIIAPNKTFNLAGLQGASVVMPDQRDRDRFNYSLSTLDIMRNNAFSLVAVETAYRKGGEWYEQMLEYLTGNLSVLTEYFKDNPHGAKLIKPEATYLPWIDLRDLNLTREEIHEKIIMKGKVALDYGYRYGSDGFLRFCIGCPRAMLKEGIARIDYALSNL